MTVEVVGTAVSFIVILLVNFNNPYVVLDDIIILLLLLLVILPGAYMLPCMKLCCSSGHSTKFLEEEIPLSQVYNARKERSRSLPDMWAASNNSNQPDFGTI